MRETSARSAARRLNAGSTDKPQHAGKAPSPKPLVRPGDGPLELGLKAKR
jgi:hypothetical protein